MASRILTSCLAQNVLGIVMFIPRRGFKRHVPRIHPVTGIRGRLHLEYGRPKRCRDLWTVVNALSAGYVRWIPPLGCLTRDNGGSFHPPTGSLVPEFLFSLFPRRNETSFCLSTATFSVRSRFRLIRNDLWEFTADFWEFCGKFKCNRSLVSDKFASV